MYSLRKFVTQALAGAALLGAAVTAQAGVVPYPTPGTGLSTRFTFTASATGDIVAYFAGSSAAYDQVITMLVNGVPTGIYGLHNHASAIGQSIVLGSVHAGDTIVFVDKILSTGEKWYSDKWLNSDGKNHIYTTSVTAGQISALIPAGIYVGFEDIRKGGDKDYNDMQFVFTNVADAVPEPATWAMMLIGFAGLGFAARRRKTA